MHSESRKINAFVKSTLSALFAWRSSIILVFAEYCGWLYFCGYQFSWIERKWHISGVQNSGPYYFPSLFIQKITNSWVLEFVDWTVHENHENWYPTKIKPYTVCVICIFDRKEWPTYRWTSELTDQWTDRRTSRLEDHSIWSIVEGLPDRF